MSLNLKIVIAEPSAIVRSGLEAMLKHLSGLRIKVLDITSVELLVEDLKKLRPDVLIINPSLPGYFAASQLKEMAEVPDMKCFALLYTPLDPSLEHLFDNRISIFDTVDDMRQKLESLRRETPENDEGDEQQTLSAREREIVVCVVKGMTNREIADKLFLSTHTVITHRRNIARKLQVHSASALTIYAIVNKLVELKDINK